MVTTLSNINYLKEDDFLGIKFSDVLAHSGKTSRITLKHPTLTGNLIPKTYCISAEMAAICHLILVHAIMN